MRNTFSNLPLMLSNAVRELKVHKTVIETQIKGLTTEINKIDQAITVLVSVSCKTTTKPTKKKEPSVASITRIKAARKRLLEFQKQLWAQRKAAKAAK